MRRTDVSAGIPPTGEPDAATVRQAGIKTAARGIKEGWDHEQIVELLQMIGSVPTPPATSGPKPNDWGRRV